MGEANAVGLTSIEGSLLSKRQTTSCLSVSLMAWRRGGCKSTLSGISNGAVSCRAAMLAGYHPVSLWCRVELSSLCSSCYNYKSAERRRRVPHE